MGVPPSDPIPQASILDLPSTPEEAARSFLASYGQLFGFTDQATDLKVIRQKDADRGRSFVRFQQTFQNIPVLGGELIVQMKAFRDVISVHGKTLSINEINTVPVVNPEKAEQMALELVRGEYGEKYGDGLSSLRVSKPALWIYNPVIFNLKENATYLVWRMEVESDGMLPIRELVLVDSKLGDVLLRFNQVETALYREVYDHKNVIGKPLPGDPSDLKRSEGQGASGIADVDKAYDYAGDVYNFYYTYHERDSIDGAGMKIVSTTRWCPTGQPCPYGNASWNSGHSQMLYGDGYASADDVVGHEMTHGITKYESSLYYYMQSGAINEAFSDILGGVH
jgi:Zn-dependent metalloprotease